MQLSKRVLLVEDEPIVSLSMTTALEDAGFAVISAVDGKVAIDRLESDIEGMCALVTDIRLGKGPDGWEVATHARELNPSLPIAYGTGDSAHEWPVRGVPKSTVLQKPFADAQLITAVSSLLGRELINRLEVCGSA